MPPDFTLLTSLIDRQDPQDISYLSQGSRRQRAAVQALRSLSLFERLAEYSPVLTGTIPLGLDLPGSDLDVLCEVHDRSAFLQQTRSFFRNETAYSEKDTHRDGHKVALVRFAAGGFPVEIFGQPVLVTRQRAYQHMLIEARLLRLGGETAYRGICDLRVRGLKTEPAFAHYFRLPGDPFETLLELQQLDENELINYLQRVSGGAWSARLPKDNTDQHLEAMKDA